MTYEPDIEKAKKAAAGSFGENMGKFPLLFAKTVLFGRRPHKGHVVVRNGTITLVDFGSGTMGLTCKC